MYGKGWKILFEATECGTEHRMHAIEINLMYLFWLWCLALLAPSSDPVSQTPH